MRSRLALRHGPRQSLAHLAAVLVLSVACSSGSENPPSESPSEAGEASTPAQSQSEPIEETHSPAEPKTVADIDDPWLRPGRVVEWTGDLDGMAERGFIRLLTPAGRTHYFVDGARERGIAVETANTLELVLDQKFGSRDPVRVVVIPVRRDQLIPMLTKGRGDVAVGGLTVTPERQALVDFATPVVTDVRELVVTAPGVEPVSTPDDLSGREVWVRRSSSYFESLQELSHGLFEDGLAPVNIRVADENLEDEGILEMVNASLYPATVVDSYKLDWIWAKVFDKVVVNDVAVREKGEIAVAFRKDSPQLAELLNGFYRNRGVGSQFGEQIADRYFRRSRWLHSANATADRQKFDAVIDIFKKYSDQYDFDYLMMVAQGYQESRLNPDARSPVGAIGIMQVMPETAAGSPLFMPNVDAPDPNIHAGVKYMRHLMDEYFDDPEIDEVNRYLLAFAAYNAGPNRVRRLRSTAPDYGLDPNLWFKNVQYVVASKVGQEPIKYVGNIYKYYLGYRRLRDIEEARAQQDPAQPLTSRSATP